MQGTIIFLLVFFSSLARAQIVPAKLKPLYLNELTLKNDLARILKAGNLPETMIKIHLQSDAENSVRIHCSKNEFHLEVKAKNGEKAATVYKALRELGFLFPHPLRQISPTPARMREACETTVRWNPALPIRGFHLHTLHPSEWVHAFYMGRRDIAEATVRWLARNGQNVVDVSLLRLPLSDLSASFSPVFELAQSLEIHTGVSLGIALQQQKSYKLLTVWESLAGFGADEKIKTGLTDLMKSLPLSFLVLEAGTSEFTPTNYNKTLEWLKLAGEVTQEHNVALFTKVHVSTNQKDAKLGNYNFLPQYAPASVGIWPHTVMFYGLNESKAPMYGNKNFQGMRDFMLREKSKRPTWYYPETSYWVAMDLDVPLLLTDYLLTRTEDLKWLNEEGFEGHMNFTTGHGLGGWLPDWNLCLMTDRDYSFDPLTPLRLLGEETKLWQEHMLFQHKWFKQEGHIAYLTSANLQDELSSSHRIHDRRTMRELRGHPDLLQEEITALEQSFKAWPPIDGILDPELRTLLRITKLRHEHALELRKGMLHGDNIDKAINLRREAQVLIEKLSKLPTNYPDLPLFKMHANPTGYQFGYLYPAAITYFWEREERAATERFYFPLANNIYKLWDILF